MTLFLAEFQTISLGVIALIATVFSLFTGGPIIMYLRLIRRDIDDRINKQDLRIDSAKKSIKELADKHSTCKIDCQRTTVSKEDWIRSEGYSRQMIENVSSTLNRMEGKLEIAEQLPAIVGNIVSEVVDKMNKKENH